jgi:hypothetical protein
MRKYKAEDIVLLKTFDELKEEFNYIEEPVFLKFLIPATVLDIRIAPQFHVHKDNIKYLGTKQMITSFSSIQNNYYLETTGCNWHEYVIKGTELEVAIYDMKKEIGL